MRHGDVRLLSKRWEWPLSPTGLDRHRAGNPSSDLQQVRFHVDDLVLAVPFAGEEVLQAIGLEPDGAVDEAVLLMLGHCGIQRIVS